MEIRKADLKMSITNIKTNLDKLRLQINCLENNPDTKCLQELRAYKNNLNNAVETMINKIAGPDIVKMINQDIDQAFTMAANREELYYD